MNLLEVSHDNRRIFGYTLIELLLVISLAFVVGVMTVPLTFSSYRSQIVHETKEGVISSLRKAQSFAIAGVHESAFGVKILSQSYVFFEGTSYVTRNASEDIIFPFSETISVSGLDEVVFVSITGMPQVTGSILFFSENKNATIDITSQGNIE